MTGRPVIVEDLSIGTCGDPDARLQLDTMDRPDGPFPCDNVMLSPSTLGTDVSLVGLNLEQICLSPAEVFNENSHVTDVMRVRWGGLEPSGEVQWGVETSLTAYSYVSLRVGQRWAAFPKDKTEIDLVLETEDLQGTSFPGVVTLTPILQQDESSGFDVSEIMRTFRVPMKKFVEQGAVLENVKKLIIRLPDQADAREILIDSIAFEKSYGDLPDPCQSP
jgi:hypothetical protein